tara:strand:- start:670 stop:1671 length:1002 start_codon:yes stop_codon:yes gene_type:complete
MFVDENKTTPKRLLIPMIAILFTTLWYSDHRIHGFAISRTMIYFTLSYDYDAVMISAAIAFLSTMIYAMRKRNSSIPVSIAISSVMATLPVLVSQDENSVDYVMIAGLITGLIASILAKIYQKPNSYIIFQYTAFAWLIMSWGAWAGAVSMIFYACFESVMEKEWSDLKIPKKGGVEEFSRQILLGLLPVGIWFAWWASLGQIDGIVHTRDVDPGNLFLKGGYIGDRISPSNTWVFFMGAGPVILVGTLWWNLFRRNGWPLQMALTILVIRLAGLSLQLSLSPNLPRLVFKIGWDMLFCIVIIAAIGLFIVYDKLVENNGEKSSSPIYVDLNN